MVARFGKREVDRLVTDARIVRHRGKIESTISNARLFVDLQDQFSSFDKYLWRFVDGVPRQNAWKRSEQVPARSIDSDALSKDLKRRGFRFVGTTIMYAFMQATGMVNDHTTNCFRWRHLHKAAE